MGLTTPYLGLVEMLILTFCGRGYAINLHSAHQQGSFSHHLTPAANQSWQNGLTLELVLHYSTLDFFDPCKIIPFDTNHFYMLMQTNLILYQQLCAILVPILVNVK